MKIVVFGAHPDDPETGCGGTIARYVKDGHDVVCLYLTHGEAGIEGKTQAQTTAIRTREALAACAILGCRPRFLSQIDGQTELTPTSSSESLAILQDEQPDILFTHWPLDTHPDHQVCAMLGLQYWTHTEKKPILYFYEVITGRQTRLFTPDTYVDITAFLALKHKACYAHQSQKPEDWYPHSHAKMEEFRGMERGYAQAEAFIRYSPASPFDASV